MTRQIFAAEINFEDAPLHVYDKFNGTEKNVKRILVALRARVEEVYILATRQRFTVYVVHDRLTPLTDYFHSEQNLKGYVQFYYNSGESVTHLMATASGLLSPIKGEGRVLSELIQCYKWATDCACLGITLDTTLTKAIETGKAVRTETGIDKFCSSVLETGLELLYNGMENLHKKNFLVLGTGKMARLALEYLNKEGFRNIAISGHDHPRAVQLGIKFAVKAFHLESFAHYFTRADVVIAASHDELKIDFTPHEKRQLLTDASSKNRFILDLGIPPNFDAHSVEIYAEEYYNIDDLRRLQSSPLEAFGGLEGAWRMVMKTSGDFVHLLQLLNHSPLLAAYLTRQFTLKKGEWNVKPKRTLRNILQFKKADAVTGVSALKNTMDAKLHMNNHLAENGWEIVRNVKDFKKFKFYLAEN
jgi:glutamyl-tRNA reductase